VSGEIAITSDQRSGIRASFVKDAQNKWYCDYGLVLGGAQDEDFLAYVGVEGCCCMSLSCLGLWAGGTRNNARLLRHGKHGTEAKQVVAMSDGCTLGDQE
jgi:hypothetical protein